MWNLRRAFWKLKVSVAMVCMRSLEHCTLTTWDSSSQVGSRGHSNRLPQLQSEHARDLSPSTCPWPAAEEPKVPWHTWPNSPTGLQPPVHPSSLISENLVPAVLCFYYSSMSAYARHCMHGTHYLPNTSTVPLQVRGCHPHTAVRNLSLEKLGSLPRARIQTQTDQVPEPFCSSLLDHTFFLVKNIILLISIHRCHFFLLTDEAHIGPCWPPLQVRYKFLMPGWTERPVCDWTGIKISKSSSRFNLSTVWWRTYFILHRGLNLFRIFLFQYWVRLIMLILTIPPKRRIFPENGWTVKSIYSISSRHVKFSG